MASLGTTNIEEVGFEEPRGWAPDKKEFTIFRQENDQDSDNDQELYGNPAYQEEFEEDQDSDEDIEDDFSEFDDSASEMSEASVKIRKTTMKNRKIIQGTVPVHILYEETDFFPEY
jgi:hypothetical protein